jgi:pentatricopeptide repeat protein
MSALRSCVKAQQFGAGLAAYEVLAGLVPEDCGDVWSILLFCAVEVGALHRGPELYRKLCALQPPSGNDFVNIVRCYARSEDAQGLWQILDARAKAGFPLDLVARNRAIASCAEISSLEMAQMIFDDALARGEEVDVVSYNTLIKGYARAGKLRHCFEILREMEARAVAPSELTFGIMLEACVSSGDADLLLEVFQGLRGSKTHVNAVHYTALIKGLAAAKRLPEAKAAFAEMRQSEYLKPDVIAYSTLMKALCDARAMADAVELLEVMFAEKVRPDSIVFHNLFLGFHADQAKPETVLRAFELMRREGIQPTTSTLSIFLKCLAGTGLLVEALAALESMTHSDGRPPEVRLYAQLAWDCIRSRCGAKVVDVYKAMARAAHSRGEVVAESVHDQLVMRCAQGGMPQTAQELHRLLLASGGTISRAAARTLVSANGRTEKGYVECRQEAAPSLARSPA